LTVLGSAAVTTASAEAATRSHNLVKDPNFRHGTRAWTVTKGARVRVSAKGHNGHRAIAIRNVTSHRKTINVNDRANTVARTVAGKTYTASVWIRIAKKRVTAAVREGAWRGSSSRGAPKAHSRWLRDHKWHRVSVSYRARSSNDTIDFNVLAWKLPPRATLFISQPTLVATGRALPGGSHATTPPPPPTPVPPAGSECATDPITSAAGVSPVFDDEFTGTAVDRSKWRVRNNTWGTNEYSLLTSRSKNVVVSNGVLTIRAQRERYTAYSQTRDYTSGYLDTIGIHSQEYGRWTMCAKLPTAKGLWPAFWLRSDHSLGEIDILESVGGLNQMTSQTVLESTMDHTVKRTNNYNVPGGIGAWHVYGFTWTPTSMSWDIDGRTVYTVKASDYAWTSSGFQDTMNIRLNLQVGGEMPAWWKSDVDSSTRFPADYEVDWVRVYPR
jgi:beta-glucanase (GH16 family)